jgi:putative transposase
MPCPYHRAASSRTPGSTAVGLVGLSSRRALLDIPRKGHGVPWPDPRNGTMTFDPTRHHRRSLRLPGHDYRQAGACFITLCTHDRACLFGEVVGDQVRLTALGETVRRCWQAIPDHFSHVRLDAFVVMPNHVHGILWLANSVGARHAVPLRGVGFGRPVAGSMEERFGRPVAGSIPTIIRSFKSAATREINAHRRMPEAAVWLRGYFEHVIRDEPALGQVREYLANNPRQWAMDRENPARVPAPPGRTDPTGNDRPPADPPWAV